VYLAHILWKKGAKGGGKTEKETERKEGHGKFTQKPHPLGDVTPNPQRTQTTPKHSTAIIFSFSF